MISGVLLDLSGTLHVGPEPLPGAVQAEHRLREKNIPVRFVTNTSRMSRRELHRTLLAMGFKMPEEHLVTAPQSLIACLKKENLRPFLLVDPRLEEDFADLDQSDPNAVVVAFAGEAFTYERLNTAFRLLRHGAPFLATGRTPYFQGRNGLQLDAGPFIAALEYAAGVRARIFGKPSPDFFRQAAADLGCPLGKVVMVGDDAASDVGGALAAGMQGILVQTGKYRKGDEEKIETEGAVVLPDLEAAVSWILEKARGE